MDDKSSTAKPGAPSTEPSNLTDSDSQEITDDVAKTLFEKAVKEIIALASEEPRQVIATALGNEIKILHEEKTINRAVYYETTANYEELKDYYAEIFSGDALDWIMSTKFADVDGILYCSPIGGASGWGITNLEISNIDQVDGSYTYEAIFDVFEGIKNPIETTLSPSQFTIERVDNEYRILNIDFIPYLLK